MRIVVFGLTITSAWGNGHATLWRALCRALVCRGHHITFFERDVSYYADTRDLQPIPEEDLPAGSPGWWRDLEAWAQRTGTNAQLKRATITMTVPTAARTWPPLNR